MVVLLAAVLLPGLARAAENPVPADKARNMEERRLGLEDRLASRFRKADGDRNGALTKDEFDKGFADLKGRFEDIDANRDQQVSWEELAIWRPRKFDARRAGIEARREGEPAAAPAQQQAAKP